MFNVKDYGAKGDGIAVDSPAIQKAIDACFEVGGGTVYIPEGIEVIDKYTFAYMRFHTYYFPKSLTELRNNLFSIEVNYYSDKIRIVYAGTSEEFKRIAAVRKEEVCESGGFDRYPYYSGGSRWVTYYRCFDNEAADIEVDCSDGVTLLYGSRHRKDNEPPKIKE